jgi:hypothetical protein
MAILKMKTKYTAVLLGLQAVLSYNLTPEHTNERDYRLKMVSMSTAKTTDFHKYPIRTFPDISTLLSSSSIPSPMEFFHRIP